MGSRTRKSMAQLLDEWGTAQADAAEIASPGPSQRIPRNSRASTQREPIRGPVRRKRRRTTGNTRATGRTPRGQRMRGGLLGEAIRLSQGRTDTINREVRDQMGK
jgi:hypothetical protein